MGSGAYGPLFSASGWLLRRSRFTIISDNATEAINYPRECRPACVVLGESIPGTSGLQLFRPMRATDQWRNVPVIFYSGAYD